MKVLAKLVHRQFVRLIHVAVDGENFSDSVQRENSPHWRQRRRDEKPVIASCIAPDDGGRSVSPQSVGEQPLLLEKGLELAEGVNRVERHRRLILIAQAL